MRERSIRDLLYWGACYLKKRSVKDPRREANLLLAGFLGKGEEYLYAHPDQTVAEGTASRYQRALFQRGKGRPLAYLTGYKEFYGLRLKVDPRVLIPRPETEILLERVLYWVKEERNLPFPIWAADLGTGSGALAVALARYLPYSRVWAADISSGALALARENARRHGVQHRIFFARGSYWEALPKPVKRFNVIVSNPPYITAGEMRYLPRDVKNYEPEEALYGGPDGLNAYRCIFRELAAHLRSPGLAVIEISPSVCRGVDVICRELLPHFPREIIKDYRGHQRAVQIRS